MPTTTVDLTRSRDPESRLHRSTGHRGDYRFGLSIGIHLMDPSIGASPMAVILWPGKTLAVIRNDPRRAEGSSRLATRSPAEAAPPPRPRHRPNALAVLRISRECRQFAASAPPPLPRPGHTHSAAGSFGPAVTYARSAPRGRTLRMTNLNDDRLSMQGAQGRRIQPSRHAVSGGSRTAAAATPPAGSPCRSPDLSRVQAIRGLGTSAAAAPGPHSFRGWILRSCRHLREVGSAWPDTQDDKPGAAR